MNDFFTLIYEQAVESGAINMDCDRDYRIARRRIYELTDQLHLDAKTGESLINAIHDLSLYSGIACLAYGFRLAAQVTAPVLPGAPAHG